MRNTFSRNVLGSRQIDVGRPLPLSLSMSATSSLAQKIPALLTRISGPQKPRSVRPPRPAQLGVIDVTNPSSDVCFIKTRTEGSLSGTVTCAVRTMQARRHVRSRWRLRFWSTASENRRARRFCKFACSSNVDLKKVCFRQSAPSAVALRRFDGGNSMGDDVAD